MLLLDFQDMIYAVKTKKPDDSTYLQTFEFDIKLLTHQYMN